MAATRLPRFVRNFNPAGHTPLSLLSGFVWAVANQGGHRATIDLIKRRLKEDRVPEVPDEIGEKKKRPQEVAFMDMHLCFPCRKCPEFCPVQCIEYLAPNPYLGAGCSRYKIVSRSVLAATSAWRCARC